MIAYVFQKYLQMFFYFYWKKSQLFNSFYYVFSVYKKNLGLNNLKIRKAMNANISVCYLC